MAKYKLGDYEFETEQEYREAAADLKRIKGLTDKYDINNQQQAAKILEFIKGHPETFRSPYGRRFIHKLEASAGRTQPSGYGQTGPAKGMQPQKPGQAFTPGASSAGPGGANAASGPAAKRGRNKPVFGKAKAKASKSADGSKQAKFQIFTIRNFTIGVIIIACVIVFSIFAPKLFSLRSSGDGNGDIRRNMVTAYAKNQADLKEKLYTYYFNVVGESEEEAERDAQKGIGHYVLDLSDRTISSLPDSEISDIYKELSEGGDIQNNSFVEPSEISVLKEKLLAAGLADKSGNGVEGETAVESAINSMMDYQERIFYSLCYGYALLEYSDEDSQEFALEDMKEMFGEVIYSYNMTEDEKRKYYDSFVKKGLIKDNQVVRFSTDPTAYNLPELTPVVEISIKGEKTKAYQSSMISYAPAASIFYEIHSGKESGYICFRNNGKNSKYISLDEETSVTVQGDFFLLTKSGLCTGEWFYNKQDIGILINGDSSSMISYVHDLSY